MQFVGYNSKVSHRILKHEGKDTAVTMSKCQVKRGQHDGDSWWVWGDFDVSEEVSKERSQGDKVMDTARVESLVQFQQVTIEG